MKYDACMTGFHKDIVAALRLMCGNDTIAQSNADEASPAPLRDYLKNKYGNSGRSEPGGAHYFATPSKGIEIFLDRVVNNNVNNNGDKSITLSWSQTAKFIRDNISEIFGHPEENNVSEENKSYLDILKEHYPNVDCEELYGEFCPQGFFKYGPDSSRDDCNADCYICWRKTADADDEWKEDCNYDVPEKWKSVETDTDNEISDEELEKELAAAVAEVDEKHIDCPYWNKGNTIYNTGYGEVKFECQKHKEEFNKPFNLKMFINNHCYNSIWCNYGNEQPKPKDTSASLPSPAQTDTAVAAFNYSVLDNDTAHSLKECETVIRTETAGYFTILGAKFKEAQDLLANHSSGTFEQWYTAMGFKRQTVYNLIQRFEFSSSPTIGGREEAFEALPLTLSYEISKPAAPAELVKKVLDGDITTNAEYRRLKAELEEAKKKLEDAKFHSKQQSESFDRVSEQSSVNYHKYLDEMHKNQDLMKQIRELESHPVEATFTDNSEELDKKDKQISELKEEIERLSDRKVKVWAIKLTLDEYEKLVGIVRDSNDLVVMEAVKKAQIIRL